MPPPEPDNRDQGLYRRLELEPGATRSEIVHAYRRLASGAHPDVHPEDADAPRRFRELTEAYEVLSDRGRRNPYDSVRSRPTVQIVVRRNEEGTSRGWAERGSAAGRFPLRASAPYVGGQEPLRAGPTRVEHGSGHSGGGQPPTPQIAELAWLQAVADLLHGWWDR